MQPDQTDQPLSSSQRLLPSLLVLVGLAACKSSEESGWKGLALAPVTSSLPLEGELTEPEPEFGLLVGKSAEEPAEPPNAGTLAAGAPVKEVTEVQLSEDLKVSPGEGEDRGADLEFKIEKKVRESFQAQLEMEIAAQKAVSSEARVAGLVEESVAVEQAATEAAKHYLKVEAPALLAATQLKIDELTFQLEMARLELEQMQQEYARFQTDSHAAETGKIVIWRESQKVDIATRRLAQEKAKKETLLSYEIPRKQRENQLTLEKAQRALARAREDQVRMELEVQLSLRCAKDKFGLLEYEIEQMRKQLEDS
jgi:hypothetical protein